MASGALEFKPDSNYRGSQTAGWDFQTFDHNLERAIEQGSGAEKDGQPANVAGSKARPMASQGYSGVLKRPGYAFLLVAQALAVFDDNTFKQLLFFYAAGTLLDP